MLSKKRSFDITLDETAAAVDQIRNSIDYASEFVPIEYYDSDGNELGIFVTDLENVILYQRIIQKSYSIGGIRRQHYLFKRKRRELLLTKEDALSKDYLDLCIQELLAIET